MHAPTHTTEDVLIIRALTHYSHRIYCYTLVQLRLTESGLVITVFVQFARKYTESEEQLVE